MLLAVEGRPRVNKYRPLQALVVGSRGFIAVRLMGVAHFDENPIHEASFPSAFDAGGVLLQLWRGFHQAAASVATLAEPSKPLEDRSAASLERACAARLRPVIPAARQCLLS